MQEHLGDFRKQKLYQFWQMRRILILVRRCNLYVVELGHTLEETKEVSDSITHIYIPNPILRDFNFLERNGKASKLVRLQGKEIGLIK